MKHTGFFNGIGGFMLAAEWMGWENVDSIEIDPWCNKIIKKNFPGVNQYYDIKKYKGEPGKADIFTGGFPCQPFSHAGKRKGTDDDRNLWPEYFRIICESKPTFVVGENVAGLTTMENVTPFEEWLFIGMESKSNLRRIYSRYIYRKRQTFVLNGIINDLEGEGYTVESFIVPACSVGAWHRRDRIWIIGYLPERINGNSPCTNSNSLGSHRSEIEQQGEAELRDEQICELKGLGEDVSNPNKSGLQAGQLDGSEISGGGGERRKTTNDNSETQECSESFPDTSSERLQRKPKCQVEKSSEPTKSCEVVPDPNSERGCSRKTREQDASNAWKSSRSQRSDQWNVEPAVGRVANGIPKRVDRLKGLGNAIVPQVAYEIFQAIDKLRFDSSL